MNYKTGIILTARSKSERYPKKILQPLFDDKKWIEAGIDNLCSQTDFPVIVAIPPDDDELKKILTDYKKLNPTFEIYEGTDNDDVLIRIIKAADFYKLDHIVRVTHDDCLFCDTELMKAMILWHVTKDLDYTGCPQAPKGTDSEVMKVSALKLAADHTKHLKLRENITYYIKRYPFKWYEFPYNYRVALDYKEDWRVVNEVYYSQKNCRYNGDIRKFFYFNPELTLENKLPRVSVYITCYNYGKYLSTAIESVLNQTYKDYELILYNDGSTDNTREIMETYKDKAKIFKNETNKGLMITSNNAVRECRGEYILRLDADDWLEPDALAVMAGYLDNIPDKAMVYSDFYEFWNNGTRVRQSSSELRFPHPACCLIRKNAWNNIRYNENLSCHDGIDFYLSFKQSFGIGYVQAPLWNYRRHTNSLSQKQDALETEKKIIKTHLENLTTTAKFDINYEAK